jgi:hypothetical protein
VSVDPDRRRALLATFERWIDELDQPEPVAAGLAPDVAASDEPVPDLFAVVNQLAALTREAQLAGRATNRLHAELGAALDKLLASLTPPDALARRLAEARRDGRLEVVAELIETRDRFTRGLDEARRRLAALRPPGRRWGVARLLRRLGGGGAGPRALSVLGALVDGNTLALERLDDALRRLDVVEVPCLAKPFDPATMRAIDVEHTATRAPGTVLQVYRPGYTMNGRTIRVAEVKVAGDRSGQRVDAHV